MVACILNVYTYICVLLSFKCTFENHRSVRTYFRIFIELNNVTIFAWKKIMGGNWKKEICPRQPHLANTSVLRVY